MDHTDEQFPDNLSETTQVTFKLTRREKEFMEKQAELLNMNLSEFCRISCTALESDVVSLKNELTRLQKENRVLRVNLNFYKGSTIDINSIVLQLTPDQRKMVEQLFGDYDSQARNISENIWSFLAFFTTWDRVWSELFANKGYTKQQVEATLTPKTWQDDSDD
jgi:hypothetical protein